jgi:hypothetical protein
MKCDDVLPALEIGDAAQERAARLHARDCPACATAMGRWLALKSSLATAPALTDQERLIWRAARREMPARLRLPRIWEVGAAAIAASVVVVLLWPRPVPGPAAAAPVEALAFSAERAEQEFAHFDRQLDQIDSELTALSNRIAMADAKRKAAELMDQYRH